MKGAIAIAPVAKAKVVPEARSVSPGAVRRMRAILKGQMSEKLTPVRKRKLSTTAGDVVSQVIMNVTSDAKSETRSSASGCTFWARRDPKARPMKMPPVSAARPAAAAPALMPACSRRRSTPHRLMQNSVPM